MGEYQKRSGVEKAKEIGKIVVGHQNAILGIVLVVLIAAFGVASNGLTTRQGNMVNVMLQSSIRGVASIGQAFVILTAGIDLSVGGIGLVSSLIAATLMTDGPQNIVGHPISIYMAIPIAILAGTGIGSISGALVSRVGMPSLIVTLGIWEIAKGAAFEVCQGRSVGSLPENLFFWGMGTIAGVPVQVIIFIVVAVIAYFILNYNTYGRSIYAVGGNPLSAWLSGIKVKDVIFTVYIISAFLAAVAGVLMTARTMSASMETLGGLELDSIASVCIGGVSLAGGRGTIIGVVLGSLVIGVINNGMSVLGVGTAFQGFTRGAIIIAAVAVDYVRRRKRD